MKKMLYLLHIDWHWIKQRPQFMAESLSKFYDVQCISPHWYNRKNLQTKRFDETLAIALDEIYGFPFGKKFNCIRLLNNKIRDLYIRYKVKRFKPDYIYITTPELYASWMDEFHGQIIYDCMDNHIALTKDNRVKELMGKYEKNLCDRADIILVSSINLKKYLIEKYRIDKNRKKMVLIRNGYNGEILNVNLEKQSNKNLDIGYIGTVSSWFDWETILSVCKLDLDVIFHIIGPLGADTRIPNNPQIKYEGIVEHDKLYEKIKGYDALMMPFIRNEIVESVDPVKLYEYINFGKDIISVYYDEIERFKDFVYFYHNMDEFMNALSVIRNSKKIKYSERDRLNFLQSSTWEFRAQKVLEACEGCK